ncbi:SDR family NAD(P)-dependent oxidoreductase [Nocardioides sp. WS12]|uniref:SDR family NAD(P)-dependent oxidoreductase n=1 Tax=Nocardioides sp. WS12 TaxID=2486272 RepID=UPI0015FD3AAA|nr:SDR family NAD(P)-dependent oxidoreductase [Nocardioides sp. WS12]
MTGKGSDTGLDRLLDRLVVPGYSAIGHRLRRRHWVGDPAPGSLAGKRAVVTGAGGGLGEATALDLARLGAIVHLVVRSQGRAREAVERITATLREEGIEALLEVEECDVSDLDSVRRFAVGFGERLERDGSALDVVVHNAGVLPAERTTSAQGHELTVATHVLGPVLMTDLLLPALGRAAGGARVVLVASGGMYTQALPVGDPDFTQGEYRGAVAYARSKRMQVELVPLLTERWRAHGTAVHAMHPGWADTPGVASALPAFRLVTRVVLRAPAAGADTITWLAATEPAPTGGQFWHDREVRPTSYRSATVATPADVATIWEWVREATALDPR